MPSLPLVTIVIGTRPECIKLAPLILAFKAEKSIQTRVILTGQHNEMVLQVMSIFGLNADKNLKLMKPNQTLTYLTSSALIGLNDDFKKYPPKLVLVQGDTSTALSASLAAFYEKIPVAHVEAGLRTNNLIEPFPEEANRRLISQVSSLHFAPTERAKQNLIKADVLGEIFITGNTVIDALLLVAKRKVKIEFKKINWNSQKVILVTVHRRENWGANLKDISRGILKILDKHSNVAVLLPMHKNPSVQEPLQRYLGNHPRIVLTEALNYENLIEAMKKCTLVLTDSGGLQEEAPSLGKPVLVLRDSTERPEAIEAGTAKIVGTKPLKIFQEVDNLLANPSAYDSMAKASNPFGDGNASNRILKECIKIIKDNSISN
tara:strand:- start:3696 stop:4823 length:1128 start_codon:yes stop_codon:yes gene_type:complete